MASKFKKLGEYVRLVDERNSDAATDELLGVAIEKRFMPSVANVIGTDLSKYKILVKDRFACNPMHVGRDEKLPIARYSADRPAIVSPAYFTFDVDRRNVLPSYLELWFARPEFDRRCWFATDASVRGGLTWDALCDIPISIPPLKEQLIIADRFHAIEKRIVQLKMQNDKLADITDLLFDSWLDEYDSAGWAIGTLANLAVVKYGKDHSALADGPYPVYGSGGIMRYAEKPLYDKVSVLIPRKGTLNNVLYVDEPFWSVDTMFYTMLPDAPTAKYLFHQIKDYDFASQDTGTSIPSNSTKLLNSLAMPLPPADALTILESRLEPIYSSMKANAAEISALTRSWETMLLSLNN